MHKQIRPATPANWEEKKDIPLWVPHRIHISHALVACTTLKQKAIREAGVEHLGDLLDRNGEICGWGEMQGILPSNCQHAYEKLVGNIALDAADVSSNPGTGSIFVTHTTWTKANVVWEIKVDLCQRKRLYLAGSTNEKVLKTYSNLNGILSPTTTKPIP